MKPLYELLPSATMVTLQIALDLAIEEERFEDATAIIKEMEARQALRRLQHLNDAATIYEAN